MRIFQVIEGSSNPAVPGNQTWHRNLYEPLIDLGHDVLLFPTDEGKKAVRRNDMGRRDKFSQRLLKIFQKENDKKPFDLFFSYLMDGMVNPDVIDAIRSIGVPTCNFSCNNAHQFYLVEVLSPHFDYNLHSEKDAKDKFLQIGANPLWWPMASNPRYFKPRNISRTVDVSFVGANYAPRTRYIGDLLLNGISVHAYGPGWYSGALSPLRSIVKRYKFLLRSLTATSAEKQYRASTLLCDHDYKRHLTACYPENLHQPIPDDESIALYSKSHVSLGFLEAYEHNDPSRNLVKHLHLREFEAPMCGALYCTGHSEELFEFFIPDKEVLVYQDHYELVDKVRYYLSHLEEAEKIRQAALRRAASDHTYHRRYEKLFSDIGLK